MIFYKELYCQRCLLEQEKLYLTLIEILRIIKNEALLFMMKPANTTTQIWRWRIPVFLKIKDIKQNNAQIFFSSHNHETLDLLQNDQSHLEKERQYYCN